MNRKMHTHNNNILHTIRIRPNRNSIRNVARRKERKKVIRALPAKRERCAVMCARILHREIETERKKEWENRKPAMKRNETTTMTAKKESTRWAHEISNYLLWYLFMYSFMSPLLQTECRVSESERAHARKLTDRFLMYEFPFFPLNCFLFI